MACPPPAHYNLPQLSLLSLIFNLSTISFVDSLKPYLPTIFSPFPLATRRLEQNYSTYLHSTLLTSKLAVSRSTINPCRVFQLLHYPSSFPASLTALRRRLGPLSSVDLQKTIQFTIRPPYSNPSLSIPCPGTISICLHIKKHMLTSSAVRLCSVSLGAEQNHLTSSTSTSKYAHI